jgi:formate/nitrite transporter FocA (FNT family)
MTTQNPAKRAVQTNPPGDDLTTPEEQEPKKESQQILRHELKEALDALERPANRLFFSGLAAGMEVGFSLFLMAVMLTLARGRIADPRVQVMLANMYAFGFVLVILGRSEFFTEQTSLAIIPLLNGDTNVRSLLRLWTIIYLSNLLGAGIFAGLTVLIGPRLGVIDPAALGAIAGSVTDHPGTVILLSGIMAGWLMGLLSWLVAAGRDTISQIVMVWMITTAIGLGHFHHAIAGSVEVLAAVFAGQATLGDYGHFLLWATLGNLIGGPIFVAMVKYGQARPSGDGDRTPVASLKPSASPGGR